MLDTTHTTPAKTSALLVGLPNTGKSTLFNLLTGGNRKVSNYSGITVDVAYGDVLETEDSLQVLDLPGIYHLNPTSFDEGVTISSLLSPEHQNSKIIIVLDWQRMAASLGLASALLERAKERCLVLINKDDEKEVDVTYRQALEKKLGAPVLPISAIEGSLGTLVHFLKENVHASKNQTNSSQQIAPIPLTPIGASYLSDSESLLKNQASGPYQVLPGAKGEQQVASFINQHLVKARQIIDEVGQKEKEEKGQQANQTEKLDRLFLHPVFGVLIFLTVFYLLFNSIYSWAGPVMDLTEGAVLALGGLIGDALPAGMIKSMIVDGIFAGVGGVVIFLPQIMILFFLMSLLEQSGYIARAALVVDRFMNLFGLGGKAFLPYLSGYACAIPGIMAARTIPNPKERMATILTLPLITCSARIPVYVLLIGTFVPSKTIFGFFHSQALAFFFLYFLGSLMALVMAKIFRLSFFKGDSDNFIMDLPPFQRPSLRAALHQSWLKGRSFLKKAGTIILGLSLIIWLLSTFPQYTPDEGLSLTENEVAARQLENSTLGRMGHLIEPIIEPLGMDWKIGVGLLVSFGARELFVGAMGTLYALGEADEESQGLRERLLAERHPETGKPIFDLATAWSILMFFVFGLQCTSTLAILKKESGGWKVPAYAFGYMFVLAYGSSFLVYRLLS